MAIMGAGLSGLACAIMLERNGIYPTIYESRSKVGDRFINGEALFSILTRPINDSISYLSNEYELYLKPTSHIGQMVIHSENSKATINERIGFVNIRGRHELSFENQLAEQVNSELIFNSEKSYEELSQEYTHVVMATGDASYAIKVKNFKEDLSVTLKGATVEGNFERFSVSVWLNNELAPKGYGYLLPFSDKEANIVIAFPDEAIKTDEEINKLWDRFFQTVCSELGQSLKITDQFQIRNYKIGICNAPRIGNTFFTGNCFGAIMPFLGFGQFQALLTGIYAAQDICGLGTYEQLTKPLMKSYEHSLILRRALEQMNNNTYDFLISHLDGRIGSKIFQQSTRNPLKVLSYLIRPFIKKEPRYLRNE
ncbi:NAD(P)/FAD-dependent oxidoreductase [Sutcliffiella sp. NC1]|uniref:NAD(P)/FAD-dependent oxidoreductase n=1 Tax=Sutcliffiella sp. NC1 TaxID=3004096 RepID=UPI0022DD7331|nr:NAD(P)/FAD-dependent oxidoreductase [Sutcliffiella sp. NC1]WBL17489.1 NAD(P)/FAD-dependent oxidoreductase [Sutcliffiella sp. NC1]